MTNSALKPLKTLLLILAATCLLFLALSFLPPVKDAVLALGGMLKGAALRRPEKWFGLLRQRLLLAAVCLAALHLLLSLVQRNWSPMRMDGTDGLALFMSDANLLSVIIATAASVVLTLALKGRIGNMPFFAVQACTFACIYFASCACLLHNRQLQGKASAAVQFAVAGMLLAWLVANFIPSSQGALWQGTARIRFRYRMPLAVYLPCLTVTCAIACMAVQSSARLQPKGSRKVRLAAALVYSLILSSLFYVPNIFGDDPYHIQGWEGTVLEVMNFVPYDADHEVSMYGHYGMIYLLPMRLLLLLGLPCNVAVAALQFLVTALMFLSVMYVLDRLVQNDAAFYLFMLGAGSFLQFGTRAYFQQEPHRMFFGAVISAYLIAMELGGRSGEPGHKNGQPESGQAEHALTERGQGHGPKHKRGRWLLPLLALGAASLLWNTETGLVCMGGISLYLFMTFADCSGSLLSRRNLRVLLLSALAFLAEFAAAMLLANAYNLLCGGRPIGFKDFIFPFMAGQGLVESLEWPLVGIRGTGFAYFVLFMLAICFALLVKLLQKAPEADATASAPEARAAQTGQNAAVSPGLYATVAFLGLGFMTYYIVKCSRGFLNMCQLQFVMLMAGIWGLLDAAGRIDAEGHDSPTGSGGTAERIDAERRFPLFPQSSRFPLIPCARLLIVLVFSALLLDNLTIPERIQARRTGAWRTEKLDALVHALDQDLPEGTPGFGLDVQELYAYMGRDIKIHTTDWANLRYLKDADSRPFEYVSTYLKDCNLFLANDADVGLVPEAAGFRRLTGYRIGGQHFGIYAREGASVNLSPFKGRGTADSPYLIESSADLVSLSWHVNSGQDYDGTYFRQCADIDLSAVRKWTPIADGGGMSFNGNYDGGGHVIRGLRIRKTKLMEEADEPPSLFGRLGGRVCNLGIESGSVKGIDCAAAFASACGRPGAVIANCWNNAEVHALETSAGIAVDFTGGRLACCVNFGNVSKEFPLHGSIDGICAGGAAEVWGCHPMEDRGFDFDELAPLLKEAEGRLDLGGMRLIPW